MPVSLLPLLYYSLFTFIVAALGFLLLKKTVWAKAALSAGSLICGFVALFLVITEHRLPLYGAFESAVHILFVLSMLELLSGRSADMAGLKNKTSLFTCGIMLFILALQINQPKAFNHDFFMYENVWVNLFFNLRLTAAAVFIHAAVLFNAAAWTRPEPETIMYRARNVLLAGVVVFLTSEWSGSLWCLNWLGDTWRWSGGFFKASIIFLLSMASFHLPPTLAKSIRTRAMIGSCPAIFIIWMIFYH